MESAPVSPLGPCGPGGPTSTSRAPTGVVVMSMTSGVDTQSGSAVLVLLGTSTTVTCGSVIYRVTSGLTVTEPWTMRTTRGSAASS